MAKDKEIVVAIDLGNLQTKIKTSRGEHVLPSNYIKSSDMGMKINGLRSSNSLLEFESNVDKGVSYTWGTGVNDLSNKDAIIKSISFDNRYTEKSYQLLLDFALGYVAYVDFNEEDLKPLLDNVLVTISLPTEDYFKEDYKKALKKVVSGMHTVTVNGEVQKINVKSILFLNQSVGTLFEVSIADDYSIKTQDYMLYNGIIVDYGGGTILMDGYENANLTNDRAQLELGAFKFYQAVLNLFIKDNTVKITEEGIQKAIKEGPDEDGKIQVRINMKRKVDITPYVEKVSKSTTDTVLQKITSTFKNKSSLNYAIFTGGGANLLDRAMIEEALKPYETQVVFLQNSEMANVRGHYKNGVIALNSQNQK